MRKIIFIILYIIYSEITNGQQTTPDNKYEFVKDALGEPLFLTPLIRTGQIDKAQQLARVDNKQMNEIAPSYSGFLTVNETFQSNMFFWYFPAKENPETAPVIIWIDGGPGASFMGTLFQSIGPFSINPSGELYVRNYSWHINHHMLYIDNPVGAGFSYTENEKGYARNENDVADNLYKAVIQFFTLFPHLQSHDIYIAGESYGKYVPALGYAIHTKTANSNVKINLKGLLIDSGLIDTINQMNYGEYLYQIGLIDENGKDEFQKYESLAIELIKKKDFEGAFKIHDLITTKAHASLFYNLTGLTNLHNYLAQNYEIDVDEITYQKFVNSATVRRSLHVSNFTFIARNEKKVFNYFTADIVNSVADWVIELLSHYRMILYHGQLDIICAFPLLENAIRHWNFSGYNEYKDAKRHIWHVDSDIAGYIKQGGNLTTVLVRNSGHCVSDWHPVWSLDLITKFIANNLLSDS